MDSVDSGTETDDETEAGECESDPGEEGKEEPREEEDEDERGIEDNNSSRSSSAGRSVQYYFFDQASIPRKKALVYIYINIKARNCETGKSFQESIVQCSISRKAAAFFLLLLSLSLSSCTRYVVYIILRHSSHVETQLGTNRYVINRQL